MAALGHLAQTLEQAAQPRRRHWLGVLLSVPVCRHLGPAQRLGGGVGQFEHEDLLGLAVVAPARRASGLAGKAAGQPQRAPVRRAVAGPDKARDIHERLRQKDGISMQPPGCPAMVAAAGSAPAPARPSCARRPGVLMPKRESLAIRCRRRNCCSAGQPIQRSSSASLNAPGCHEPVRARSRPCTATWRRPLPMTP